MMKNSLIIVFAFFSLSLTACGQSSPEQANTSEVANTIKRVTKQEFNEYLKVNPDVTLIDVRTTGEYANGTISHAKNIDFYSPTFRAEIDKLDKTKPILIFCMSGGRSSKALKIMNDLGFEYVLELAGGYGNY